MKRQNINFTLPNTFEVTSYLRVILIILLTVTTSEWLYEGELSGHYLVEIEIERNKDVEEDNETKKKELEHYSLRFQSLINKWTYSSSRQFHAKRWVSLSEHNKSLLFQTAFPPLFRLYCRFKTDLG